MRSAVRTVVYLLPMISFVALAGVFLVGLERDPSLLPSPLIGKSAPAINMPALDEKTPQLTTADMQDRMVLVNFFASWCGPCRAEHSILMQLATNPNLRIVGINYKDATHNARRWLDDLGNPYTHISSDRTGRASIDWGVYGLPESFLINDKGTIIFKHVGPLTSEIVQREIIPRLRERNG